jgi:hypothetical protein
MISRWMCLLALLTLPALAAEPKAQIEISSGGKRYTAYDGGSVDIDVGGKPVTLKVREMPFLQFSEAGLKFDYPRYFSYESDPSPPASWILDGNDVVVQVLQFDADDAADAKDLLVRIARRLKNAGSCVPKATFLKTRSGMLSGYTCDVKVINTLMHYEIYRLDASGAPRIISFQQTLAEDGSASNELLDVRNYIARILKTGSP